MQAYRGELRRPTQNELTPTNSSWERNANFQQAQRQKYEKSQLSYYQSEASHTLYDHDKNEHHVSRHQNSDNKELYEHNVPVKISSQQREEYVSALKVQIVSTADKGTNSIIMLLTDDNNPKFLWTFTLPESEFVTLKNEQHLKVDFGGFPEMIIDNLGLCENVKDSRPHDQTYFHCLLEIKKGDATLNIVQTNKYKESIHLKLNFRMATNEAIIDYLSDKLTKAGDEAEVNRGRISKLQDTLSIRKREFEEMEIRNRTEIEEKRRLLDTLSLEEKKKYNELKGSTLIQEEALRREYDIERKKMIEQYQEREAVLTKKYDQVRNNYEKTSTRIHELQSIERDLKSKLSISEKELTTYLKQLEEIKLSNKDLDAKRFQNQKAIAEFTCKIESLNRQIEDKNHIIESATELKSNTSSHILSIEEKSKEYKKQCEKFENKITDLEAEISRLNATNNQLREKYDKKKEKVLSRNEIIRAQQKKVQTLEANILELKKSQNNLKRINQNHEVKLEDKEGRLKDIRNQLEESQKKIQQQNGLITHLQKQLNERTVGYRPNYTSGMNSYTGNGSMSPLSVSRDFSGISTESRLKSTVVEGQKSQRIQPVIKKYTGFDETRERSKSPIANRLNQMKDPQEDPEGERKVKPVKFKNAQRY